MQELTSILGFLAILLPIRKDENYEKNYLIGKYCAIPTLKSIDIFKGDGWSEDIGLASNGEIRMGKKDRTDNRKIREQRKQFKVPELCCQGIYKMQC